MGYLIKEVKSAKRSSDEMKEAIEELKLEND